MLVVWLKKQILMLNLKKIRDSITSNKSRHLQIENEVKKTTKI